MTKSIQNLIKKAKDNIYITFEHFLPTQVVVLCFNFVGTCFNIVSTCLVESKAEVLKDVGKLLAQIVGILDGVHQAGIPLRNLQFQFEDLVMVTRLLLYNKCNGSLLVHLQNFPAFRFGLRRGHHQQEQNEPTPYFHYITSNPKIKIKVNLHQFKTITNQLQLMIVTESLSKIDAILSNMKMAHSRILSSFKIESGRAIRQDSRTSIVYNEVENNKSFKFSKDSTMAQSKEPVENEHDKQAPEFSERRHTLNQIMEESMDENQSYQQLNPLKNFISPNSWFITNSRNQQKSVFQIDHEPQCASFRHIQEVELPE